MKRVTWKNIKEIDCIDFISDCVEKRYHPVKKYTATSQKVCESILLLRTIKEYSNLMRIIRMKREDLPLLLNDAMSDYDKSFLRYGIKEG